MAHEIFSVSTINTKRNLLAVSILAISHVHGWINLSALPFINGTTNSTTPISEILLTVVIYLSISAFLHVIKDLDNQTQLPSVEELNREINFIRKSISRHFSSFILGMSKTYIEVNDYLVSNYIETYEKLDERNTPSVYLIASDIVTKACMTYTDWENVSNKNSTIKRINNGLNIEKDNYGNDENNEDNFFYILNQHTINLQEKEASRTGSSNLILKKFETIIPTFSAVFAFFYLIEDIFSTPISLMLKQVSQGFL